jgi:hypothetical protein
MFAARNCGVFILYYSSHLFGFYGILIPWHLNWQTSVYPVQDNQLFRKEGFLIRPKTNLQLAPGRIYMILLDIFLFVGLILLLSPFSTGLSGHEIIGTIFFLAVILHLLFSWSWIKGSSKRFLVQSGWRERFNYFLNLTLFVFVVLEIVSGLIISEVLVPSIGIKKINDAAWRGLHNQVSVGIVFLISLHISLNWQRMVSYFRKKISSSGVKNKNLPNSLILKKQVVRFSIIIFAAVIIASLGYLILGAPVMSRVYAENEITRFRLNPVVGTVQVLGSIISILILAYISWRWLKVRL